MASFKYIALTTSGKERKGSIQAPDANAATATLREQGLFIVKISDESKADTGLSQEFSFDSLSKYRSVSRTQLVFFFKQLSFMLRAGLPILQALQLSQTQVSSGRLKLVIGEMLLDIENGHQLSKAMEKHTDVFPTIAVNLMAAGESTGSLDSVANRLATHLEKKAALRAQTINAMIYPAVVLIVAIGVVIFLVVSIIPKFAKFLLGQGKALPASTQFLIDASDFALKYGIFILAAFFIGIVSLFVAYKTPIGRLKLDAFSLKIPVIGKLLMDGIMAEFNWSLSMMLRSGLTALESLRISGKVISNRLISDKLFMAADQILTGKDLASSLKHPAIPDLVIQMTSMGEKTGTLDQVLQEVGSFYEEQLQVGVKRMSAMIEPAMILIIGGIVGFVYYAFFQALFSLVSKG
ncbi:MAG: type II secretion protein F [Methylotenera sp.]|uniref:type II secretion system F family protein n=1 Tax=Methylotenera sp. TaxID=2051956 RepID=UPI000D4C8E7D|nr:type II secretion system F family protein [Methylotenera sp.]PPC81104.1 MAG: type II secretion protein F [Methylotenera sp.]